MRLWDLAEDSSEGGAEADTLPAADVIAADIGAANGQVCFDCCIEKVPEQPVHLLQRLSQLSMTVWETCASQKSDHIACETTFESTLPVWSQAANHTEEHQANDSATAPQPENEDDSSDSDAGPKRKRKQRKSRDKGAHRISAGSGGSAAGNTFFADLLRV